VRRRLLQRPGHLREMLHGRCRLRQVLQKVKWPEIKTPDGFPFRCFLFDFIADENLFSFRR
jgi:hypothetical protein